LSFMPRKLAANPTPHAFWYKPFPSPPKDPARWAALIEAFTRHLLDRYGAPEVEQWYFEVWNEPNIDFWNGVPKEETYYQLYDATAHAIKRVNPRLRVGGPATAQAAWVDRFIEHCTRNHIPFDFVSTHVYANDTSEDVFGTHTPISRKDMVARAVQKVHNQVKASAAPNTPIIWSEYNASYKNEIDVTDSAFMGPWLANNIRECDGLTSMMSYWTFSDVFEEQGVVKTPFYGGYGLIAERGIPKAAFSAFELLHELGDQRLPIASENTLATKRKDGAVVLALWNYVEPGSSGSLKEFHLSLGGARAGHYRLQIVDPSHGSALQKWIALGRPAYPSKEQIAELVRSAHLPAAEEHPITDPIRLAPEALALVELQ